jgi:hypothetical protein
VATAEGQLRGARGGSLARLVVRVAERPEAVLLVSVGVAMLFNLWETRGQTFFSDEWSRFLYADNTLQDLLRGHSGHLVLLNTLTYKVLLHVFGAGSYLPFRIVEAVLLGACGLLFYILARGRARPWPCVAATLVLLFLGSAVEVTATPYGIVILLPVFFGLAALVCLDRAGAGGDVLTCLLLVAAIAAHSDGLAFLVGATVLLVLQSGRGFLKRIWVVAVPALLYGAWLAWYHLTATSMTQEVIHLRNLSLVPSTVVAVPAAGLSAISGLFGTTSAESGLPFNIEAGYLLLGLGVVAAVWRVRSGRPIAREVWVPLALGLTFWALLGMVASAQRPPTASRYLYPTAIFLLLIILELTRGIRATPAVVWATVVALVVSLIPNIINLNEQAGKIRDSAAIERAELGGIQLLRQEVPFVSIPDLVRHARLIGVGGQGFHFPPQTYFNAVFRYGSPAATPQQVASGSEAQRQAMDKVLLQGHDLTLSNVPAGSPPAHACRQASGSSAASGRAVTVPPAGLELRPQRSRSQVSVSARRFATAFAPLTVPKGSGPLLLKPGVSQAVRPWLAQVSGATVCELG